MKKINNCEIGDLNTLKVLFEKSTDGVLVVDTKKLKFLWVNSKISKLLKYSKKELLKKNVYSIHKKTDLPFILKEFKALSSGKRDISKEIPFLTKDKKIIYFNISCTKIRLNEQGVMIGFLREVTKEKKLKEKLEESELRYRRLFETAQDGILILDFETGIIIDSNPFLQKIIGCSGRELFGKTIWQISPLKDIVENKDHFEELRKKGYIRYEHLPLECKKGKKIDVEFVSNVYRLNGKHVIQCNIRDIAFRVRAEKELEEELSFSKSLVDTAQTIILVLDTKGRVVFLNRYMEKLSGYSLKEVKGKDWFQTFLPKEDWKKIKKIFLKAVGNISTKGNINPIITKKGKNVVVKWYDKTLKDEKGNVTGLLSVGEDVTKSIETESEIRKMATVVKYSTELINMSDLDGRMIFINNAGSKMLGIKPNEVGEHDILEVIPGEWMNLVKTKLLPTIKNGKVWEGELAYKNLKTGDITPVYATTFTIKNEETGKPLFFANVSRDISKEKEIDKIKADFVATASHQLKTPLTGIKWTTELLEKSKSEKLSEKQKKLVHQINESNDMLLDLVSDLLDVSHIETGRKFKLVKKEVDIKDEIKKILKDQESLIKKNKIKIELDKDLLKTDTKIFVDRDKIRQAFLNVINNAINYSKENGKIKIGISDKNNEGITFFVKDNGVGIPKNQQNRVFEKFFRADNVINKISGTGLGLFISKSIIEAHGGRLWFKSGKTGTTFYIFLPKKK